MVKLIIKRCIHKLFPVDHLRVNYLLGFATCLMRFLSLLPEIGNGRTIIFSRRMGLANIWGFANVFSQLGGA